MARAVWSGAVSFGLVNVPVKAYTAVRDHEVHFHQLERKSKARVRYEKVSEKSGKEVSADDITLGYEVARDKYVTIEQKELEELRPKTTRSIDIADFVDLGDIDPIYYERTYWLAPDGQVAQRAYRLLLAAMEESKRAGIGSVVMRNKQYLAAIRPLDRALALSTMRFADEIVPPSQIDAIPSGKAKADPKELKLASQIIDSLTSEWEPSRYRDTYTDELKDVLERKAKGEEIVIEEAPAPKAKVVDLMAALEASVQAAKNARGTTMAEEVEKIAKQVAHGADEAAESREPPRPKKPAAKSTKKPARGTSTRKSA
jgi:DNA end-binding protein Ku